VLTFPCGFTWKGFLGAFLKKIRKKAVTGGSGDRFWRLTVTEYHCVQARFAAGDGSDLIDRNAQGVRLTT
jgi:hypothetical protein